MENQYAIEMLNITKKFPGIIANDNITLQLRKGEIHALLGENGAGKSTLMSVLFGLYQPEEGEIHKDGRKVEIKDPNDANALGIGMVQACSGRRPAPPQRRARAAEGTASGICRGLPCGQVASPRRTPFSAAPHLST